MSASVTALAIAALACSAASAWGIRRLFKWRRHFEGADDLWATPHLWGIRDPMLNRVTEALRRSRRDAASVRTECRPDRGRRGIVRDPSRPGLLDCVSTHPEATV
ncbi:MAG: hypothetical protein JXR37_29075 [Kiritimatiellae bacterium]|nr:hypothetical protein [Kiritimatiellia bacterium]